MQRYDTASTGVRNPFGTMDVPDPNDWDVVEFAATAHLDGGADDDNAVAWVYASGPHQSIDGEWSARWNSGTDPTIAGDALDKWKQGVAEVRVVGERTYLHFNWDGGRKRGLIDVRREIGGRLIGKYINLTNPKVIRPWVGLIVSNERIDGRWTGGRLDFRR